MPRKPAFRFETKRELTPSGPNRPLVETHLEMPEFSPARAYWNQRSALAAARARILALRNAIDRASDLRPGQWAQLIAVAMEFKPDVILELGRGSGNSTVAFTEAVTRMGGNARVVSICRSLDWGEYTLPRIRPTVTGDWLSRLQIVTGDILAFDFAQTLSGSKRVLLFWDAHGFDVAECVLGRIMPILAEKQHLVIMHDMSDSRYGQEEDFDYGRNGLWNGNSWLGPRVKIGNIDSAVEQSISAVDFTTRNHLTLDSADHSFHTELTLAEQSEMRSLLDNLFELEAHWFHFSLNEHRGPYRFPRFRRPLDIVIPVRNHGEAILPLLDALNSRVRPCNSVLICYQQENDATLAALKTRSFDSLNIVTVKSQSAGTHAAVISGIYAATAKAVMVFPPDGLANITAIDPMASMIESGYDVAAASRPMRGRAMQECPWGKSVILRLMDFTLYYFGRLPVRDATNEFRAFSRRVVDDLLIESTEDFAFSFELLAKCHRLSWRIGETPAVWTGSEPRLTRKLLLVYLKWYIYVFISTYFRRPVDTVPLRKPHRDKNE
jgi:dolichol-phosphate mannosyltransferase